MHLCRRAQAVSNWVQLERRGNSTLGDMAIDLSDPDGSAHLAGMIEEFRAARSRRLVKQGIALWTRTEVARLDDHVQARPREIAAPPARACGSSVQDNAPANEDV